MIARSRSLWYSCMRLVQMISLNTLQRWMFAVTMSLFLMSLLNLKTHRFQIAGECSKGSSPKTVSTLSSDGHQLY